jgi:rRNA biogenesis protein RRP5
MSQNSGKTTNATGRTLIDLLQISDNQDADVNLALRSFHEGDRVKVMIISIDHEKRRISLSLRPSHFTQADLQSDEEEEENDSGDYGVVPEEDDGNDDDMPPGAHSAGLMTDPSDGDFEGDSGDDDKMQVDANALTITSSVHDRTVTGERSTNASGSSLLKLQGGFQWSASDELALEEDSEPMSSADEDVDEPNRQKKRKRRKEIQQDLTADMHNKMPESTADFERVLLGSPDSSYLWIQYMSFLLQMSEVDRAREVGRRALQTINFREEQEKLNVWIALLNLENVYGTEESLESIFKEAARSNDSKTVHLRLASILEQAGKLEVRSYRMSGCV